MSGEEEKLRFAMRDAKGKVLVGVDFGDQGAEETAGLVRLDVLDVSILLGPRNTIVLAKALMEAANAQITADGCLSLELH